VIVRLEPAAQQPPNTLDGRQPTIMTGGIPGVTGHPTIPEAPGRRRQAVKARVPGAVPAVVSDGFLYVRV
jgi:hypothetical protein